MMEVRSVASAEDVDEAVEGDVDEDEWGVEEGVRLPVSHPCISRIYPEGTKPTCHSRLFH